MNLKIKVLSKHSLASGMEGANTLVEFPLSTAMLILCII